MHILLASVGSLGDIHPFIALGQALAARGHRVDLVCNQDHAAAVRQAGLAWASAGEQVSLDAATNSPNLWHPIKGLGVFWKHMLAPAIEPLFHQIAARQPDAVVAPPVMFGARFAREVLGIPLLSAYTAPAVLRSTRAPLTMAHWRLPRGTPAVLVQQAWRLLDKHKLHPMAAATLHRLAGSLGASPPPAGSSIFGDWMHSPDGGLALFPEWFAPRRPGWSSALHYGGFPLYAGDADAGLPEPVQRFLEQGTPPVVFMPGSATRHVPQFFQAALAACARLGQRALLLTPFTDQLPPQLPATALHWPYLPFPALLPQARALVHHGGIGSCAQALRAGIPQVLMPMAHDQFDNAACLGRLGLGHELRPAHFSAERLARLLAALDTRVSPHWQTVQRDIAVPACPEMAEQIERWAGQGRRCA